MGAPNFKALTEGRLHGFSAFSVIDRTPLILNDDPSSTDVSKNLSGEIELKDLEFKYAQSKEMVLKKISLVFPKGKPTAIVGPSGSGKSTIVQLIERFYDPEEGQVLIDGNNLKSINLKSFRSRVGFVS